MLTRKNSKKCTVACLILLVTLFINGSTAHVTAKTISATDTQEENSETAYLDMSSVSALRLNFVEEEETKPDYYYAACAFDILQEKIAMDPMYRHCTEVIVTVDKIHQDKEITFASVKREPEVQTGYLNLLSKETSKYYTIDHVIIHIERK